MIPTMMGTSNNKKIQQTPKKYTALPQSNHKILLSKTPLGLRISPQAFKKLLQQQDPNPFLKKTEARKPTAPQNYRKKKIGKTANSKMLTSTTYMKVTVSGRSILLNL